MAQRLDPRRGTSTLTAACGLMLLAAAARADEAPHADREGVPLPKEAITRLGSVRLRPGSPVNDVAFAPDGKTIICLADHKDLQFWDARTGGLRHSVMLPWDFHAVLAFTRGGKVLRFDGNRTCRTFDGTTGKELGKTVLAAGRKHAGDFSAVARFSHDGARLARRDERGAALLIDMAAGKERLRLPLQVGPPPANRTFIRAGETLAFTPDDATLAVVAEGNRVEFFDAATGKRVGTLEAPFAKEVQHLDFSPDGKDLLCAVYEEQPVIVRGWAGKRDVVRLDGAKHVGRAAFAPDGRLLALAERLTGVTFFDPATGKRVRALQGAGICTALAFSADGRQLLVAEGGGTLSTWDVATGRRLAPAPEPPGSFSVVRFRAGGKQLLVYASRHLVLDARSGRVLRPFSAVEPRWPPWTTVSPDGKLLLLAHEGRQRLLDARTGAELLKFGSPEAPSWHHLFAGGTLYVVEKGPTFRAWDLAARKERRSWTGPAGLAADLLAVSGDGRWFAAASSGQIVDANRDVYVWDTTTGKLVCQYTPPGGAAYALAFAPSGERLAVATDEPHRNGPRAIRLLDVRTGNEVGTLAVLDDYLHRFAFSPDGRTLAVADAPHSLRLWEAATGKVRHRLEGHKNAVSSLAFSADGRLLASASTDAPGYVWDVYGTRGADAARAADWDAGQGARLWRDLADAGAAEAFAAVRRLVQAPAGAVALLRERLHPVKSIGKERLRQLLRDLGSEEFAARRRAAEELGRHGEAAEGGLDDALRQDNPVEVRRRIEALLAKLRGPAPERLRRGRALEALEQIATSEAIDLLDALAAGAPEAPLTREARAARERLRRR